MQKRAGVGERTMKFAERAILDHMSLQLQDFFPLLKTLFVASIDEQGKPWGSILHGKQGFIQVPDEKHLSIHCIDPILADPLSENLKLGKPLGFLGLEFHTRRRNRLAGHLISYANDQLAIEVTQAFGNCPKYIQTRKLEILPQIKTIGDKKDVLSIERLTNEVKSIIQKADTFFIASYHNGSTRQSVDMSHRGGKPGFVKVEGDRVLCFDDYSGNNFYMTLGNLISNPVCGILFIDFGSGDTLQLSCTSQIIETPNSKHARKIRLTLDHGWLIRSALPLKWEFCEYSPFLE